MADAVQLERDSFRAKSLEFDLGTGDLLRKRFVVDKIVSAGASHGLPRTTPGKRTGQEPPPPPPPPGEGKSLDDYLVEARKWRDRLQQANQWLTKLAGSKKSDETKAERDARIEREKLDGLTEVRAAHLLAQSPLVLVKSLLFEGVAIADAPDDAFDITASNLSSDPELVTEPMQVSIKSRSGRYAFDFTFVHGQAQVNLGVKDIDADAVGAQLAVSGQPPVRGGKLDAALQGNLELSAERGLMIDLPLVVTLRGTKLSLFGGQETAVDNFVLPLGLSGSITNPRIRLDDQKLVDALVAAGRKELADQVRARSEALLQGLPVPEVAGKVGGAVGDLLEGKKTPEQLAAEAEAEAKQRAAAELEKQKAKATRKAEQELKKKLPGGLGDLLKKK